MVDAVPRRGSSAASLAWEQRNEGSPRRPGSLSRRVGAASTRSSPSRIRRRARTIRDVGSASEGARSRTVIVSDEATIRIAGSSHPGMSNRRSPRSTISRLLVRSELADGAGPSREHGVVVDRSDRLSRHEHASQQLRPRRQEPPDARVGDRICIHVVDQRVPSAQARRRKRSANRGAVGVHPTGSASSNAGRPPTSARHRRGRRAMTSRAPRP